MKTTFLKLLTLTLVITVSQFAHADVKRSYGPGQLTSSLITCTAQDSMGYIWIGTEHGLNRFDGTNFAVYYNNEQNPTSLLSNSVRTMFCDREGRLWIGLLTGMQMYDPATDSFRTVTFPRISYIPNISHIMQLESGKILMIASRLGIYELDTDNMTAHRLNDITNLCGTDHMSHFMEDSHGRLWLASAENGIFCMEKDRKTVHQYLSGKSSEEVTSRISANRTGIITAAYGGHVWMFDELNDNFVQLEQPADIYLDVRDIILRDSGEMLIASYNEGLWKIDEKNRMTCLESDDHNLVSLMEDREGNLWCGYFHKGVTMTPPETSVKDFEYISLEQGAVTSLLKDSEENLYIGSQGGTISIYGNDGRLTDLIEFEGAPMCLYEDCDGNIWTGLDYNGVRILSPSSETWKSIPELKNMSVRSVMEDSKGLIYIGTLGKGIWCYDKDTGQCSQLSTDDPENFRLLRNSYINRLFIDSRERLWIGHFLGASCFDLKTGRFLDIATDKVLNISVGYALEEDEDGTIWIGTNNGLFAWNEASLDYTRYTIDNGLSSNMICGLAKDRDGNIWCSTFNGVNCIMSESRDIISFNTGNTTFGKEYVQRAYYSDGERIYFGDGEGVTHFAPPISTDNIERDVLLTNIYVGPNRVNRSALDMNRNISLSYSQNTFTLEFSSMAIRDADNIRFSYRLRELDDSWHMTRYGINQITYNSLHPGTYTLEVCTAENGFISPARQWKIRIGQPWYRSLGANIFYLLILAGMILLTIFTVNKRKNKAINEQRLKYYVNIAHEVRSPMVMIINPIEKLLKKSSDPEIKRGLITMKRNSERVIRMLDSFLDVRKIDSGQMALQLRDTDMVKLVAESLGAFAYEADKRGILIDFEHPSEIMTCKVDPYNMDSVISNLITNALKHTPDGGEINVSLSMDREKGYLEIRITDNGCGIEDKNIEKIFGRFYQVPDNQVSGEKGFGIGLNLCRMLVEMHDGSITAANRADGKTGAVFTVRIPAGTGTGTVQDTAVENVVHTFISDTSDMNWKEKKTRTKTTNRILIIEDDEEICRYLEDSLSDSYKIHSVRDGNSGLQKALAELPDLIISDVMLPGTDGLQIVKRIKNNSNTTHIPVVLLTSKADINDRLTGLEYGADAYMVKPFNIEELELTIDNLLKNRQRVKGKYSGSFQEDRIRTIDIKSNSDRLMEKIMKVINDNLDNPDLKVEMLAEEVGLSRAQLHRRVKEMTGISTGEFIRNIRLKKAAELLAEKKTNISQVAYMVGFSSQTHFSTAFRKFYGISPTEHINR